MVTTALFVEILVIGFIAEIWIVLLIVGLTPGLDSVSLKSVMDYLNTVSAVTALPFLALTYAVGWIVNFLGELGFTRLFEKRLRDDVFNDKNFSYKDAKAGVSLAGPDRVFEEIRFDRHLIRITRSSAVNFALIGFSLVLHANWNPTLIKTLTIVSFFLSAVSLYQCARRYKSSATNILKWYEAIIDARTPSGNPSGGKEGAAASGTPHS